MAIEVKLPELGDGIESGDVLDVLVAEGDTIEKDQPICELETDKATVEIPSSHGGKIVKIHISSGDSVSIGSTLVTLEAAAESTSSTATPAPESEAKEESAEPTPSEDESADPPSAASSPESSTASSPAREVERPASAPKRSEPAPAASPAPGISSSSLHVDEADSAAAPAGPAIRRLAREVGIDLRGLRGSGPGGRITREDVLVAVRQTSQPTPPLQRSEPKLDERSPATEPLAAETAADTESGASSTADPWGPIRVERMSKIRRTIARKMHESWSTVPRVTNFDDADVTELESIRKASKPDYEARGLRLTSMAFVIKATALALRNNPIVNASLDEDNEQIIFKRYINIGIAVDTERGLVVPSLRRPDELGIPEIARALESIVLNARESNFKLEDLRGSTFTISNLGAIGGNYSTPIINVPEVAILLLGRTRKLPLVVDDKIEPRLMMPLSLSYDHRVVDGADAARFLNEVKGYLEKPSRLLIAPY